MATRKTLKRATAAEKAPNEPSFPLSVWLENSKRMIGQPRYIIVGAMHTHDQDATYSRSEMKELVRRFLSAR